MSAAKTINIIYDGHCGFCRRSLRLFSALDLGHALRLYDSHQPETSEQFPVLHSADLEQAMYVVVDGEPIYRGFFAFRRLIWTNLTMWGLIPFAYFPGARFFGPRVYAWVARNRSSFGCHADVCDRPSPTRT